MSEQGMVDVGSRYDLRVAKSPDAPETAMFEGQEKNFGWIHSYETGSTVDGPGVRLIVFMSGCLLRCLFCHNPDTWHLKDGTRIELGHAVRRLGDFAPMLRAMGGGLTISGGEPLVQTGFTGGLLAEAKRMGLHTAIETSGFLGDRASDEYLASVDLVILDIKSGDPELYRRLTSAELEPTLRFARRLNAMGKPVWVRFVLVPGLTDDPANIGAVAKFVAPMSNVEWVEILPFHQMGAFKWKTLGLDYKLENTHPSADPQVQVALKIFRDAGCRAR
jgi:pyruvate formate lyase activating enzyme